MRLALVVMGKVKKQHSGQTREPPTIWFDKFLTFIRLTKYFRLTNNFKNKKNMKKVIITLSIGFICLFANAQTKEKDLSNAEVFSAKSGTLMQKEFVEIGTLKKCEIKVIYFTDLISNTKQSALKFEYDVASSYSTDTKAAILDPDEIDGLMKSIKLMQEKVIPTTPTNYTEVSYRSRGGFEAGCFTSKGTWSTYLKLEKFDGKSYVWLTVEDLATLYTYLEQSKAKL